MRSKILCVSTLALLSVVLLAGSACRSPYTPAPAPPPAPAPLPPPPPETMPPPVNTGGGMSSTDASIHDRVHEALRSAPDLDSSDIAVRVDNGNVYLSGTVPTASQRELAHNVAHGVDGVRKVFYDELRVR